MHIVQRNPQQPTDPWEWDPRSDHSQSSGTYILQCDAFFSSCYSLSWKNWEILGRQISRKKANKIPRVKVEKTLFGNIEESKTRKKKYSGIQKKIFDREGIQDAGITNLNWRLCDTMGSKGLMARANISAWFPLKCWKGGLWVHCVRRILDLLANKISCRQQFEVWANFEGGSKMACLGLRILFNAPLCFD